MSPLRGRGARRGRGPARRLVPAAGAPGDGRPPAAGRPRPAVVRHADPRGTRERVSEPARAAVVAAADRLLAGEWTVLGTARPDIVDPDWFLDPVTGRRAPQDAARLPDRPPRRGGHRQRQVGVGALPPPPPDRPGQRLVADRGRGLRRGASTPSCGRGGGRIRSSRASTGPAASSSASGSRAGCGCAGCSTTGPRWATSSRPTTTRCARSGGTSASWPPSPAAAPRPTTTPSPRPPACSPAASAFPWFAESDRWRATGLRRLQAQPGRQHLRRAGSTASWRPTTTASSPSSAWWPPRRRRPPATRSTPGPGRCSPRRSTPPPPWSTYTDVRRDRATVTRVARWCSTTPTPTRGA